MGVPLLADWISNLSLQQQAVLVLALRGPDGFPKYHPSKELLYHYRASVLRAAHIGRMLRAGEACGSLMSLTKIGDEVEWRDLLKKFQTVEDELPLHYYTHLMHGAQVLAYKHPDGLFRTRWVEFYGQCCDYLHVHPEPEALMDRRLSDFGRGLDEVVEARDKEKA